MSYVVAWLQATSVLRGEARQGGREWGINGYLVCICTGDCLLLAPLLLLLIYQVRKPIFKPRGLHYGSLLFKEMLFRLTRIPGSLGSRAVFSRSRVQIRERSAFLCAVFSSTANLFSLPMSVHSASRHTLLELLKYENTKELEAQLTFVVLYFRSRELILLFLESYFQVSLSGMLQGLFYNWDQKNNSSLGEISVMLRRDIFSVQMACCGTD